MRPATLLSVLMFPQAWDGHRLRGSVLLLPTGDPLHAPLFDSGAPFAGMPLVLQLVLQPGAAAGGVAQHRSQAEPQRAPHAAALAIDFVPSIDRAQARRLFEALHHQFLPIPQPSNPIALAQLRQRRGDRLRALGPVVKVLPPSYCAAAALDVPHHAPQVMAEAHYLRRLAEHAATTPAAAAASTATSAAATAAHSSPVSWGQVLSYALRQPALARALGLVVDFDTDFTGWDLPRLLAHGGWLHATLAASTAPSAADSAATFRLVGDAIAGDSVAPYAARLPPLSARARPLFAAVLFPVAQAGCEPQRVEQGEAGQLLDEEAMRGDDEQRMLRCDDDQRTLRAEAARYDDGFARVVHAAQPLPPTAALDTLPRAADAPIATAALPCIDGGIALGWDDEQVLRWVNRQLDSSRMAAPGGSERRSAALDNLTQPLHSRAPLGVAGYRVDVRSRGSSDAGWRSLCGVQGDVALAGWRCSYRGEFMVDTAPQLACRSASGGSTQWLHLPRYFAAWCEIGRAHV